MKITMIKKQLANGQPCEKCLQAETMLRQRGLWDNIDNIAVAWENDPTSAGMVWAAKYQIAVAPFFVVQYDDGIEKVYTSTLRFVKDVFPSSASPVSSTSTETELPTNLDIPALAQKYADQTPQSIIRWGLQQFGADCAIAFSGAEDVVLIDMAAKTGLPFSVFCLDTGRLHPETYQFIEKVREYYQIPIRMMSPQADVLQDFVLNKGLFSFRVDGHKECCAIRKVEPLRRALRDYRCWISGQRRDQSPATRSDVAVIHEDEAFVGRDTARLIKLNPLTHWTSQQVWDYIRHQDVPFNDLHQRGFRSIGCEPCTRPTLPGEHERAGRWWWEDETKRECGLHLPTSGNPV